MILDGLGYIENKMMESLTHPYKDLIWGEAKELALSNNSIKIKLLKEGR